MKLSLSKTDMRERAVLSRVLMEFWAALGHDVGERKHVQFVGEKVDGSYVGSVRRCIVPYVVSVGRRPDNVHRERLDLAMFDDVQDAAAREVTEQCLMAATDPAGRRVVGVMYRPVDDPKPFMCTLAFSDGYEAFCTGHTKGWALAGAVLAWAGAVGGLDAIVPLTGQSAAC